MSGEERDEHRMRKRVDEGQKEIFGNIESVTQSSEDAIQYQDKNRTP